ncbi:MAG: ferredoxin--NADP(+) reductase [bacterium]|nr:ferredoxin--NADP(+) reductase [bacterium]
MPDKIPKHELPPGSRTYKLSDPCQATVISNEPLHLKDSPDDLMHTVIDIRGTDYRYIEGQSAGVLVPGTREDGKPNKLRLYSIASARRGDDGKFETLSLCTKRVHEPHWDNADEMFRGLASNHICDLKPGDRIILTGPVGKHFALPADESMNLILMGVGTGVAPFRSFLKHIYEEHAGWSGQIRLFYGVKTQNELMYMNEANDDLEQFEAHANFRAYVARSRQDKQADGSKVYVQHLLRDNAADVWELIKDGHFSMYICGLKGMEAGIQEAMETMASENGRDWNAMRDEFKAQGKWNVEVY